MKLLGKPKNRWGWMRVTAWIGLAGVLTWTLLAAGLRGAGPVAWLAWMGSPDFSLLDGVELAVVLLLAALVAGWLEDDDLKSKIEQSNQHESERTLAARRKETLKRVHEAVLAALPEAAETPAQASKILEIVRAALPELDGKGKGELLQILYEKKLLSGEKPRVELNGADLRGAALHNAHLNGIHVEGVDLAQARLDHSHLANGRLAGVNLGQAFLRHADLRGAQLDGADLTGAHLEGANLEGADLSDARLKGAFLRQANLRRCTLSGLAEGAHSGPGNGPELLEQAILIETILPDGRKMTNEKGKEYLRNKEIASVVDRL